MHPDVIQDMLGRPPSWILRWGITLIAVIVTGLLVMSWVVRYPDVLQSRVVLTTDPPAIDLVAQVAAPLDSILVSDQQAVHKGELLAVLENTARFRDIQRLRQVLQDPDLLSTAGRLELGDMQGLFALYQQQWLGLQAYRQAAKRYKSARNLRLQLQQGDSIAASLQRQINELEQEEVIANSIWQRNQELLGNGAASQLDVDQAESRLRAVSRQLEGARERLLANTLRQRQLEGTKEDLLEEEDEIVREKQLALQAIEKELWTALREWERKHLFRAPVDGKIALTSAWVAHQFLSAGAVFATITPDGQAPEIQAKAYLPMQNSGKVAIGQTVNIQLDGYPYYEYGVVKGAVRSISLVPEDQEYVLIVELPQDLQTTYGENLPFRQQMTGIGEIITANRRFIVRLMEKLIYWTS